MKKWLRNKLLCVCMFMFPMFICAMDLGKLMKKNDATRMEEDSSDEEEEKMIKVTNLPPIVEMRELRLKHERVGVADKESPKSFDVFTDSGEEADDEMERDALKRVETQKKEAPENDLFDLVCEMLWG